LGKNYINLASYERSKEKACQYVVQGSQCTLSKTPVFIFENFIHETRCKETAAKLSAVKNKI